MNLPESSFVAATNNTRVPTLELRNLCTSFHTRAGVLPAVRDVSLRVQPGRILGLVFSGWWASRARASRSPASPFSAWSMRPGGSAAARCCSRAVT